MSEFLDRMEAQRALLGAVNSVRWKEPLFGLSSGSIDRWKNVNSVLVDPQLLDLVERAADRLFFLANKSQEQVTEDYKVTSDEISQLINQLRVKLS